MSIVRINDKYITHTFWVYDIKGSLVFMARSYASAEMWIKNKGFDVLTA